MPLVPTQNTSYGSRVLMTQENADTLLETLQVNPMFLLNMIGRPDYWAPQKHWDYDDNGKPAACGKTNPVMYFMPKANEGLQTSSVNIRAGICRFKEPLYPFICATTFEIISRLTSSLTKNSIHLSHR